LKSYISFPLILNVCELTFSIYPAALKWGKVGADIVVESTGLFLS
jgi:glyceraldehyde-3-phosphate dehydrogenase/erythrose-4-phosphate dehydrogenase